MKKETWDKEHETNFKNIIKDFFESKIEAALKEANNPLDVGNHLSNILSASDEEVVKIVTPRAVRKWASNATLHKWEQVINDPKMLLELRIIGKSIANTMRPLAGNNFALWVAKILNSFFEKNKMALKAITSGPIKKELNRLFLFKTNAGKDIHDYRPDIDIVLVRTDHNNYPVAIISAKTTLAERIMQTINWYRFLKRASKSSKKIKLFLVTAWDTFKTGTNINRVQELDGVFVCNNEVKEFKNIKKFSKILKELKMLCA